MMKIKLYIYGLYILKIQKGKARMVRKILTNGKETILYWTVSCKKWKT